MVTSAAVAATPYASAYPRVEVNASIRPSPLPFLRAACRSIHGMRHWRRLVRVELGPSCGHEHLEQVAHFVRCPGAALDDHSHHVRPHPLRDVGALVVG